MLKITKGLKKKKKGKKKSKDADLFTEEELEQYRKEHSAHSQAGSPKEEESGEPSAEPKSGENDEWSKFNALTAGVDSILKKTQGDLELIKETSFFQRVAPAARRQEEEVRKQKQLEQEATPEVIVTEAPHTSAPEQTLGVDLQDLESESEYETDGEDIFDTSFVDVVESGELQLAYIPDSPTEEELGPDPFDTSYADRIIKGPEVSKRGKKLVSIGSAVEVLTGRAEISTSCIKRPKRRGPQDLLLEDADEALVSEYQAPVESVNTVKSLLDDEVEIPDIPIDLSVSLHPPTPVAPTPQEPPEQQPTQIDLREFEEEDDEFSQLAAESISKPKEEVLDITAIAKEIVAVDDSTEGWAAFVDAEKTEDKSGAAKKQPPARPTHGPRIPKVESTVDNVADDLNEDPFDTTFAENILPGKVELKLIEQEILGSILDDPDFDPRAGDLTPTKFNNRVISGVHIHVTDPTGERESISSTDDRISEEDLSTLKIAHRDLLGGSTTDLSQLAEAPIAPKEVVSENYIEYCDPFDTSIVDQAVIPGKTELKFLEKELLGEESGLKHSLSDPDFDPRAEEAQPQVDPPVALRKSSRPDILPVNNKQVAFEIPSFNAKDVQLLGSSQKTSKPVTPYYSRSSIYSEETETEGCEQSLSHSFSDHDFNPREDPVEEPTKSGRRHSDFSAHSYKLDVAFKPDLLAVDEELLDKVLTPAGPAAGPEYSYEDPFDTTIACDLKPGKAELKLLESELALDEATIKPVPSSSVFQIPRAAPQQQDLLSHPASLVDAKPLSPQPITEITENYIADFSLDDDIDPFDTSIANNLGPGKTELKLLESELINQ